MYYVNKLMILTMIRVSLIITFIHHYYRRWKGKCGTSSDVDKFIADNQLTANTPMDKLYEIIRANFKWTADKTKYGISWDFAKHPEVFLFDKEDDCDGFAMFCEELCLRLGHHDVYRAYTLTQEGRGHVVCITKPSSESHYFAIGNWNPILLSSHEIRDIGKIISLHMDGELCHISTYRKNKRIETVLIMN